MLRPRTLLALHLKVRDRRDHASRELWTRERQDDRRAPRRDDATADERDLDAFLGALAAFEESLSRDMVQRGSRAAPTTDQLARWRHLADQQSVTWLGIVPLPRPRRGRENT